MSDIIYYNISIDSSSIYNSGLTDEKNSESSVTSIIANNSNPIIDDPSKYYCSVIRFSVPCFKVPLIQFLVQTPVTDINKGIYSFTLFYNGVYSEQVFYNYIPQIGNSVIPKIGTPTQDFNTFYYFLYNYSLWVNIQNIALKKAFLDLVTKVTPALDTCKIPFFDFDAATQLMTLYVDPLYFDNNLSNYITIYFNAVSMQLFNGYIFNDLVVGSLNGADCYFVIINNNSINIKNINSYNYLLCPQEFVSLSYLSPLKNILVTTNMNVNSEIFYINQPQIGNLGGNNNYINVLTDFIPDLSATQEAGIGSKIFIYNAPSLYRIFEFKTNTPLYTVSLALSWADQLGNVYPLKLAKGTIANIKLMFVKKTISNKFIL